MQPMADFMYWACPLVLLLDVCWLIDPSLDSWLGKPVRLWRWLTAGKAEEDMFAGVSVSKWWQWREPQLLPSHNAGPSAPRPRRKKRMAD
jgi:hypothetical protein